MADDLVPRGSAEQLSESVSDFRIVIVNGPRQAGKTTLLELFQHEHGGSYHSLDDAETLRSAQVDPVTFIGLGARPVIIDEVQRGGDALILAIKRSVDRDRTPGRFVLSGSTRFLTVPTLSESLAGRAVFVDLWPFAMSERTRSDGRFVECAFRQPTELLGISSTWTRAEYLELVCTGSFPEVLGLSGLTARRRWFNAYTRTVIARDIAEFADVQLSESLPRLLSIVAARQGRPFVHADVAGSLAINHETVRTYLSYLQMVFLTTLVPAWSTNATNRVTKTPKAFVTDSGLAAHLIRATPDTIQSPGHPALGGLVETFVVTEMLKLRALTRDAFDIYHYRDRDGREIDLVCETPDGQVIALEIKASASPSPKDAKHLRWLRDRLGERFIGGFVVHLGQQSLPYDDRVYAVPLSALWMHARIPEA